MNSKRGPFRRWFAAAMAGTLLLGFAWASPASVQAAGTGRTYTLDADFAEGFLVGLNHSAPNNHQLQLNSNSSTFPFIWVANSGENTISKLDTVTGAELGRYKTGPDGSPRDPSRTTVDLNGNVWVGNRAGNTVTKVGLLEAGACIDRNGNGTIETSTGAGDVKAWPASMSPADECILLYVTLPGPGNSVRMVAVDANNDIYAGFNSGGKFFKIDGDTGAILLTRQNDYPRAYGAVVDPEGNLWIANQDYYVLTKYNPTTDTLDYFTVPHFSYGLGIDRFGHIWVSGWTHGQVSKYRRSDGVRLGTYPVPGGTCSRGVAVEQNGDVWVANSCGNTAGRLGNDGTGKGSVPVGNTPTGVAIDAAGKVWVTNLGSNNATRIDPMTNTTATFAVGMGPYNYSDMTGFVVRNITTTIGTWTATHDSGAAGTAWGTLSWNGSTTPGQTSIGARVRAADTVAGLGAAAYVPVSNGAPFGGVTGRYIQIEMTLQTNTNGVSPVLYDVTVTPTNTCAPGVGWKPPLSDTVTYNLPIGNTLPIAFTYGCTSLPDDTVIVQVVSPTDPYTPITTWVYGYDITFDGPTGEYRVDFHPSWYGLTPGMDLLVQVYMNYEFVGDAPFRLVP